MNFIQLRSFDNYLNANIQLGMLQHEGINCHLKDEYTITIDPLLSPAIGGMKLMVYETQALRAIEILEEVDKNYLRTISCPECGNKTLESVTQIKKPSGFLQTLFFMVVNGQSEEVKKIYRCTSCHATFTELPV